MENGNNLLDNLTDALGTSDGQTTEEVIEDIKTEGIDAERCIDRINKKRLEISKKEN